VSGADRPTPAVVAAGGAGVLAVVVFVAALVLADLTVPPVGPRVRVTQGPAGAVVLVGRCLQQRVTSIEVVGADGAELWRFDDPAGSIDRHYGVDRELPEGGRATATVAYDHGSPARASVDLARIPLDPGPPRGTPPPCAGEQGIGVATFLLVLAALAVVGGYVVMLTRLPAGRGRG
jgi:hypothetical protein